MALALSLESSQGVLEVLARNPENANNQLNAAELFKAVDAVSAAEINNVRPVEYLSGTWLERFYFCYLNYFFKFVKKLAGSKPSLAAVGDLSELANVDELAAQ